MTELPEAVRSRLLPVDRTLETLETPAVLIDAGIADANLARWQERCDRAGLANRPHIKTHRTAAWALRQVELGAKGVTVQTVGEAEVMADAGITDLFLTTNTLGAAKLARLGAVAKRCNLSVVADSREVVDAVANAATAAGARIRVLVECDTGGGRCGLADPAAIAELAKYIAGHEGLSFGGLMTYPAAGKRLQGEQAFQAAIAACRAAGLEVPVVSSGGSPDMWKDDGLAPVTEYRAGTYIYNDRALLCARHGDRGAMRDDRAGDRRQPADGGSRHRRRRLQGAHLRPARPRTATGRSWSTRRPSSTSSTRSTG